MACCDMLRTLVSNRSWSGRIRAYFARTRNPKDKSVRELEFATDCGLECEGVETMEVDKFQFQFRSEFDPILRKHLVDSDGHYDRSLTYSPLVGLLRLVQEKGEGYVLENFRRTDYYGMFAGFAQVGYAVDWATGERVANGFTDEQLYNKIAKFVKVFQSVERYGYLGAGFNNRHIIVTRVPYEVSRFAIDMEWKNCEIWSGHHRAASLLVLGYREAAVKVLRWRGIPQGDNGVK